MLAIDSCEARARGHVAVVLTMHLGEVLRFERFDDSVLRFLEGQIRADREPVSRTDRLEAEAQ